MKASKTELTTYLRNQIEVYSHTKINQYSLILVGSNYNTINLNSLRYSDSDLDVFVLSKSNSQQLSIIEDEIRFDFTFINQNEVVLLVLSALEGNPYAGKILTALNEPNTKLYDTDEENSSFFLFKETANHLYSIFLTAIFPDYTKSHVNLFNINVNKKDLSKSEITSNLFTLHRLSILIFDYLSKLVYPFHSNGSFQGKIINNYYKGFKENFSTVNGFPYIDKGLIDYCINQYIPVTEQSYKAISFNQKVFKFLKSEHIKSFYFGYDNLINENPIVFVSNDDFNQNTKVLGKYIRNITNIVPLFSYEQFKHYTDLLTYLSQENILLGDEERTLIFLKCWRYFIKKGFQELIYTSLKAILIKKSFITLQKENLNIDIENLNLWLSNLKISQNFDFSIGLDAKTEKLLSITLEFTMRSDNQRETDIKVGHIFFGIMKSLRINIKNLECGSVLD